MAPPEFVKFVGINVGSITIGMNLITKELLEGLFDLHEKYIIATNEGEEVPFDAIQPNQTYTIVTNTDMIFSELDRKTVTFEQIRDLQMQVFQRATNMQNFRSNLIKEKYKAKHEYLYQLDKSIFHPDFISNFEKSPEELVKVMNQLTATGIHSFPMFTDKFCNDFIEEVEKYPFFIFYPFSFPSLFLLLSLSFPLLPFLDFLSFSPSPFILFAKTASLFPLSSYIPPSFSLPPSPSILFIPFPFIPLPSACLPPFLYFLPLF